MLACALQAGFFATNPVLTDGLKVLNVYCNRFCP